MTLNGDNTTAFSYCGSSICYNGQCIGSRCVCTFGYLANDCSESWRDVRYYYTYQCWHWTLMTLFAISALLISWRLIVVARSKLTRLALPRASGHMAVCRARCTTLFDTQTGVLFLVLCGALAHTMQFADPWTIEGVLTMNSQLFVGNVAVTTTLLALSLWIRFFAGVHARFDANTKRALRALDAFILTSCTIFGALITWQFINIFAIPSYELLSTLTLIYTATAAIFVVVLIVASIIYAVTTLRFVVRGTGTNTSAPLSAGQLAAQRLAHTLRMIQGICVIGIIIVVAGWIIDPYNSDAWFAMGFLALYRGLMLLGYVGILPVMGKAKPPGVGGMGARGSQLGSQLVIAGSPNAAAAAAAAAFIAAGRSPRYQALQVSSPDIEPIGGSPMSPKRATGTSLWKVAAAQSSQNLRRVSPIVTPLSVPLSARGTTASNNGTPSPHGNNNGTLNEGQITTVVISPRTLSPPATAMGSPSASGGGTATVSPRSPAGVASPRHTPRNGSLTVKQSPYGGNTLTAAQLAAQITNKRASGAYRTSASLQSAASLSLNNNDHTNSGSGATPTAMSHHAHTTMARDLYNNGATNYRVTNASHTPASSSGGSNTSNGVYIVTTPPSPSVPAALPMPTERVASLTSVDIVTNGTLGNGIGHDHHHGNSGYGNNHHVYTIHDTHDDSNHDDNDGAHMDQQQHGSDDTATAITIASAAAGGGAASNTVSPPRALRLGTFVDVRTLEPRESDTINL